MILNEIRIAVPWGTIAAKTWGDSSDPLVLAVHGWADNADSFDLLMPLLPHSFYYVCVDLPGHGKSSPVETSLILRDIDYVIVIKMIYDYFKRDKIILIGHSMGGFVAVTFTQLYPKCVSKLVTIDLYHFYPFETAFSKLAYFYNQRIKFLTKKSNKIPEYTREEIIEKIMIGRRTPLSRKAAEVIIDRNLEPTSNGKYRFIVAPNVKQFILSSFTLDGILKLVQKYPIKCPHMVILSSESSHLRFAFREINDLYKKNVNYEFHVVDGPHEVHIDNPEGVAPLINTFLLKQPNKL